MLPDISWVDPVKFTVPELWVKVPPVWEKSPDTLSVDGAVKVPLACEKFPVMEMV